MPTDADVAQAVVTAAGAAALKRFRRSLRVAAKRSSADLVTDADVAAQQAMVSLLTLLRPDDGIVAEEGYGVTRGQREWVLDPLDGTVPFVHGLPTWSCAAALRDAQGVVCSAVLDPVAGELFAAARDGKATCNAAELALSRRVSARDALVHVWCDRDVADEPEFVRTFGRLARRTGVLHAGGSGSQALAWVAAGRLDAYIELFPFGDCDWDWLPGELLVRTAGGSTRRLGLWRIAAGSDELVGDLAEIVHGGAADGSETLAAPSRDPSAWASNDAWTSRGRARDARARTRADIVPPDALGLTTYPRYAARAEGAYVWDVDGRRYIDYLLGYGPVVLGHADRRVTAAVTAELELGNCTSPLWSRRQVELTELLACVVPGAELALLLKTGSDATSAAVRLARIFTGREKVLRWGYNGWHDWSVDAPAGVPAQTRAATLKFDCEPASLKRQLHRHPREVACVITMPFENDIIQGDVLRELRELAHEHGALFVLDELRSGFRLALGGAQEHFTIQADLATFGKAMANGYAISAVTGRAEILECLVETKISSTHYASPFEMAAAQTTIELLRDTDAIARLWAVGSAFQDGLSAAIANADVAAEVVGYPPMPFMRFLEPDAKRRSEIKRRFYAEVVRRGVLLHPDHQWFVSTAHSDADIVASVDACSEALRALRRQGLA